MKILRAITGIIRKAELYFGAVVVAEIFILTTLNIIMRYIFNSPIFWCEEVILYSFVWMGYLAVAYTLSMDNHVRFTLVLDKIPKVPKTIILAVLDLMIAAVFVILIPSAVRCMGFLINTPALKISEKYFYYIVPIGYSLMIFHSVVNMLSCFFPEHPVGSGMDTVPPASDEKAEA